MKRVGLLPPAIRLKLTTLSLFIGKRGALLHLIA